MVLLRDGWEAEYHAAPEVYRVGCAGKIVEATPLPDGKFNIVLAGIREFDIVSEQRERAYRQATVEWRAPAASDPLPATATNSGTRPWSTPTGRPVLRSDASLPTRRARSPSSASTPGRC